jgi:hypothetical protein
LEEADVILTLLATPLFPLAAQILRLSAYWKGRKFLLQAKAIAFSCSTGSFPSLYKIKRFLIQKTKTEHTHTFSHSLSLSLSLNPIPPDFFDSL